MTFTEYEKHPLDFGTRSRFGHNHSVECKLNAQGEFWVAGAAVAISAGAAAYSSYSSSSAQKDALEYQASNQPKLVSYTPVLAKYDPSRGVRDYLQVANDYGYQTAKTAETQNQFYQDSIDKLAPVSNQLMVAGQNNARLLRGELPKDLSQQIARSSAQAALTGGYGADSGQGRNLVARDFGKTSLDLQQQGLANLGVIQGLAQKFTPFSGGEQLGNAQQYAARGDAFEVGNAQTLTQAEKDKAGVQNQNAITDFYGGLAGVQANSISPYTGAIVSGIGSAAAAYSGGAASGYGFGGKGQNAQGFYGSAGAAQNAYGPYANVAYSPGAGGPNGGGGYYAGGWHG